ncbi:MAG TPA: hypothetical protein VNI02_04020 [Blastocatellia bacterium]|jgi:hypothetical protein|nr:hypothetical protein [Blastocatellia bacterium]
MKDNKRGHASDEIDRSGVENPDVRHEVSDVRIKPILYFGVGLVVAAIIIHLAMAGLFDIFETREKKAERKQSPLAAERQRIPPEPRLYLSPKEVNQPRPNIVTDSPLQEYKKLRAEEDAKLSGYTWVDENAGVVAIPINEAKRLVLQRGLLVSRPAPARPEGQQQTGREELPSDSSAGQKTEKRHP